MIKLQGKSQIITKDETVKVVRSVTEYNGPIAFTRTESETLIQANVQPLGGKELMLVPEGDRFLENFWLWTEHQMQANDTVHWNGKKLQVQAVKPWGSYTQSRMVKIDVGPAATD